MKRIFLAVSLAASMWACNGETPTSPTEPEPPLATYTLSGVVTEVTQTGQSPVEGARVEVSNLRLPATTDRTGSYRIAGVPAGSTVVTVSSQVHETARRNVTIAGDTRLDIQVIRRPFHTLSGVVSEVTPNGLVPIEGVHVEDAYFHAQVKTDTNGFYSFAGFPNGTNEYISFRKDGYQTIVTEFKINGDTRLDVQLVRL